MKPDLSTRLIEAHAAWKAEGGEGTRPNEFPWSETTFAVDGRTLLVHERADRPGSVRVRWQLTDEEHAERGGPKRPKLSVAFSGPALRDDRGRVRVKSAAVAVAAAKEVYEEWLNPRGAEDPGPEPWTLQRMLMRFTDPEVGARGGADWKAQVGTFPIKVGGRTHVAILARELDLDARVEDITDDDVRRIYVRAAKASVDGSGCRKVESVISTLYSAANHSRGVAGFPRQALLPLPRWKKRLKQEWATITDHSPAPSREPYKRAEAQALTSRLDEADPRLRLALVLGTGYRVRQVATRARRSGIGEGGPFGRRLSLVDHKRGGDIVIIDLTPRQQRHLDEAMATGFLAKLEAAYQAGDISDYHLIAGGQYDKDGQARVSAGGAALSVRRLHRLMEKHEESCGVAHVDGRMFHGLRRAMEKLVGEHTTDEAVRDIAGGWTVGSGTRQAVYTDAEDEDRRSAAAHARAAALEAISSPVTAAAAIEEVATAVRRICATVEVLAGAEGALLGEAVGLARALTEALERAAIEAAARQESATDGPQDGPPVVPTP
jgi:hypothetical protein